MRRTAGELLDDRLKILSSGLYALARFLKVSFEDRNPSKPCAAHGDNLVRCVSQSDITTCMVS